MIVRHHRIGGFSMRLQKFKNRLVIRGENSKFASCNGPVAEWLGKALQKLLQRFESARDLKRNS
jgi:hypothetical protein